jgi:hypothetical protein
VAHEGAEVELALGHGICPLAASVSGWQVGTNGNA